MREAAFQFPIRWSKRRGGIFPALCGASLLAGFAVLPATADEKVSGSKPRAAHGLLAQMQNELSEVAEEVIPAVVTIVSVKRGTVAEHNGDSAAGRALHRTTGSGFIVRPDGWVLTNDHVVADADRVIVRLRNGRELRGLVYRDLRSDLALIKITAPEPLPAVKLGDSDKVKIGHWAIAVGSPFHYEGTFSFGIVSSLSRRQEISDPSQRGQLRVYQNLIQTDAAINPGNSGGPLCNIEGEVIAINTATETDNGASVGIGFAIPINTAKFVVDEMIANRCVRYGYIGIPPAANPLRGFLDGFLIDDDIAADTPARKAGLRTGDIITGIDDQPVHNEADLGRLVSRSRPGTTVRVKLLRKGQEMNLRAVVDAAPVVAPPKPLKPVQYRIGLDVETLTPELVKKYRTAAGTGVVVRRLDPDSEAADNKDITEGVVIVQVNDTDTPTLAAYNDVMQAFKPGSLVRLRVRQPDGTAAIITLPVY